MTTQQQRRRILSKKRNRKYKKTKAIGLLWQNETQNDFYPGKFDETILAPHC